MENAIYIVIYSIKYIYAKSRENNYRKNLKNFCNKLLLPFKDWKRKNNENNKINQNKIKTQIKKYIYIKII